MKKTIFINGGAGRVFCALPALERYITEHPDTYIISESGIDFVLGHPLLQNKTYDINTKGLFENIIKQSETIVPEPYYDFDYYNQNTSIAQTFDKILNGSVRIDFDYKPNIIFNKQEKMFGLEIVTNTKSAQQKTKTIVIQPFGRTAEFNQSLNIVTDNNSRSLNVNTFLAIAKELRKHYNVITMSEFPVPGDEYTRHIDDVALRVWASVIAHADYFIGCDSVGQHFAYAVDTPGTVILGSTFAQNVSYPNYFNIIEKEGFQKQYCPIRISSFSSFEADQLNDKAMDFDENETKRIIDNILADIKLKTS
jgi:hypothetical protein